MEDALYEIASMRLFAGLSLDKAIPDHSTILKFRHLLEQHGLARQIFDEVNQWLSEAGVLIKEGSLIDATIIEAPSSTKNRSGERDPEMHQTKKALRAESPYRRGCLHRYHAQLHHYGSQ